jgi:hypothetical protein
MLMSKEETGVDSLLSEMILIFLEKRMDALKPAKPEVVNVIW